MQVSARPRKAEKPQWKILNEKDVVDFVYSSGGGRGKFLEGRFRQEQLAKSPVAGMHLGFGRISFPQLDTSTPYIKVPWNYPGDAPGEKISTHPQALLHFVENVWKLPRPKLLISITGGALDFSMREDGVLCKLMETARSTNAWVVTGGTNVGIMKHVGQ